MHRDPPVVPTLAPTDHDGTDLKVHVGEIGGALLAWHPLGYGIWQSAVYGAIAGGSSAAVNGGNVLQGAAIGAFSAANRKLEALPTGAGARAPPMGTPFV